MFSSRLKHLMLAPLMVSLLLVGCLEPDKRSGDIDAEQGGQAAQSSFYVTDMKSPQVQPPTYDHWKLPTAANYKFNACVISRATRQALVARKFRVSDGNKVYDVVTDGNGCFEWTESVPFSFFADQPRYLVFERTVTGTNIDTGSQKIEFALDPWKATRGGEHAEFIYLRRPELLESGNGVRGKEILLAQNNQTRHQMTVENMLVDIQQRKQNKDGSVELSMAFQMNPTVRLARMDGSLNTYKFANGTFTVEASILAVGLGPKKDRNYKMTEPLIRERVRMENGDFRMSFKPFNLNYLNTDGNLVLALKITPDGQGQGLEPYTAVYRLGDFNQWLGTKRPLQQEDNAEFELSYNQLLNSAILPRTVVEQNKRDIPINQKYSDIIAMEPYRFGSMTIKYNGIKAGETATSRTVAFDVKICVTNTLRGGVPVVAKRFKIVPREGAKPIEKMTNDQGCFAWIDEVSHRYYKPEQYLISEVKITDMDSEFTKSLNIAINPWDLFATFGKDLRDVEENDIRFKLHTLKPEERPKQIESRFNLADFGYTAIRFDYDIKRDLSLNVKKSVLLKLHPEVQRYSSITGGRLATERLRDGIWSLKIAIQKDYLDPATQGAVIERQNGRPVYRLDSAIDPREKQYISVQEKLVRVINGRIITPVEFQMRDLRLMRIRSNMLIQLEPIDETKLQIANIMREHLDTSTKIAERLQGTLDQLATDRYRIQGLTSPNLQEGTTTPSAQKFGNVDVEGTSADQRQQLAEAMSLEERRAYYNDRMAVLDKFVSRMDSSRLRTAIHTGDTQLLEQLVDEATGVLNNGRSVIPDDLSPAPQSNDPLDLNALSQSAQRLEITRQVLDRLRLNDFTVEPAAPTMSLKYLVEDFETSGLRKRTFVGPVTFLHNSNGSEVRPTDTLDEVFCLNNTCDSSPVTDQQLKDWSSNLDKPYAYKRYYGWVAHFFNKNVDDLIYEKRGGERTYKNAQGKMVTEYRMGNDDLYDREMKARSLVSNFVTDNDLIYVSLKDRPLQTLRRDCTVPFYDDSCLIDNTDNSLRSADFLAEINSVGAALTDEVAALALGRQFGENLKANQNDLQPGRAGMGHNAPIIDPRDPLADMGYFTATSHLRQTPSTHQELEAFVRNEQATGMLSERICHTMINKLVRRLVDLNFVHTGMASTIRRELVNHCIRNNVDMSNQVLSFEPRYKIFDTGRIKFKGGKSLNVNVNQSFSLSNKVSEGFKLSYDFLGLPRVIPIIKDMLAGAGIQIGRDTSRDASLATSIVESAFLVVQMATFDIELTSYEKCVLLGYKHDKLAEVLRRHGPLNDKVDKGLVAQALSSGYMICSGVTENTPKPVRERYYYVTQHFTEGDMLDSGDLYNHPWLLAIRGVRDFETFMLALHGDSHAEPIEAFDIMGDVITGEAANQTQVKRYTWPLDRLVQTYLYIRPTFPGLYSNSDHAVKEFSWTASPEEAFDESGYGLGKPLVETVTKDKLPEGLIDDPSANL